MMCKIPGVICIGFAIISQALISVGNCAGLQPEQVPPPCPASDNKVDIKCVTQQAKDITVKISPKNLESKSSA